jgi:hypothetical protein
MMETMEVAATNAFVTVRNVLSRVFDVTAGRNSGVLPPNVRQRRNIVTVWALASRSMFRYDYRLTQSRRAVTAMG